MPDYIMTTIRLPRALWNDLQRRAAEESALAGKRISMADLLRRGALSPRTAESALPEHAAEHA